MTKQERTAKLIEDFRGNKHEFQMLKGVLCMGHAFDCTTTDFDLVESVFDGGMIASRMDEINGFAVTA
jgi:hypothetical protein